MVTFADIVLEPRSLLTWLVVGLIAGCLAGMVMKGSGYGIVGDIIVGLLGGVVGGFLFGKFGPGVPELLGTIVVAFIGACILIAVVRFVSRNRTNL